MGFLTILVTVFFYLHWVGDNPVQKAIPFDRYQTWFIGRNIATTFRFLLCVGTPCIVVFWLALEIQHWALGLFWLLLSLAVVIYSIELHDTSSVFDNQISWLQSMGGEHAIADAVVSADYDDMPVETDSENMLANVVQRHEDFVVTTIYDMFQSIIPVLFWFLLIGPAGALLYAMSTKYLDCLDLDDPEVDLVEQVVYWMEWLPMRISGLLLAFLGHFGRGFEYWLEIVLDTRTSNAEHLAALANIAIDESDTATSDDIEGFVKSAEHNLNELQALMERTLYGWVGLAALATIIGL
ncbi:MAG: regulatory signaling modulator protein AmpE [bacterium]|nr:hypothetical protein [Gammaproteobacteria bacterium]HIL95564.1 hypothetical protein [Pseudomonadales bacterium]